MEHLAIDLGGSQSQVCVRTPDERIVLERKVDGMSELREVGKDILLIGFNASGRREALGAIYHRIFEEQHHTPHEVALQAAKQQALRDSGLKLGVLYDRYRKMHAAIDDCFDSGIGKRMQRWDPDLMDKITRHFVRQEIPVLGVHDSVIIAARHEDELREVMTVRIRRGVRLPHQSKRGTQRGFLSFSVQPAFN